MYLTSLHLPHLLNIHYPITFFLYKAILTFLSILSHTQATLEENTHKNKNLICSLEWIMTRPYRFLSTVTNSSPKPATESPEAVSGESDFVVIFAALLCALVCVIGLIVVARCAWLRRRSIANHTLNNQPSANKGIKKKHVNAIPKFAYSSSSGIELTGGRKLSSADCAICLAEYADGDEIRVLPQCGHGFHVGCIDKWLGSHSSCPSCRQVLVITRCKKCGEFPAVSDGNVSVMVGPLEGRQHSNSNSNNNSDSSSLSLTILQPL